MAGNSTRGKSPGSGYQGAGAKTDYSSRARNSYGTEMTRSQKTDYAPNARDSYATTISRNMNVNAPTKNVPRTYAPTAKPKTRGIGSIFAPPPAAVTPPAKKAPSKKAPAKKPPAAAKPITRGSTTPTRVTQPTRMAINPRTGDTTGFTTGKTTGTSVSKPGVAGKTERTAYGAMMANAERRFGEAGPTGGGGGRIGGGTSPSRSSGGGTLGGARGRIGEEPGSKK